MHLNVKKFAAVLFCFVIVLVSVTGIFAAEPEPANWKVVDLSHWNDRVNWSKLSSSVDGVILKIGYRGSKYHTSLKEDDLFYKYYKEAVKYSMHVGCYFYSYAYTAQEAAEEARWVISKIKAYDCRMDMPIYIDMEAAEQQNKLNNRQRTDIAKAFCSTLAENGFYAGLYSNKYWATSLLYMSELSGYTLWIAQYNSKCTYTGKYDMWQFTESGTVSGITGKVDISYCYKNFPKFIKENGYNLYAEKPVVTPEPEKIATEYNSDCGTYKTLNAVNVYSGAGSGFGTIGSLPSAAEVCVSETGSSWGKISFGKDVGWIKLDSGVKKISDYISTAESVGFYEVTAQALNIRTGPSSSYSKDGLLSLGEKIFIYKQSGGWGGFYCGNGKTGWINLGYTAFIGTICFSCGSGKGIMAPQQAKTGQSIRLSKCTFTSDEKFEGWATQPDGAIEYSDEASFKAEKSNVVLYAVFSKPIVSSFPFNEGTDVDQSLKTVTVADKRITAAQFKEKYISLAGDAPVELTNLKNDRVVTGTVITAEVDGTKTVYTVAVTGDLNSDGVCDSVDLHVMLTYLQGSKSKDGFTPAQLSAMDVNRDGKIDTQDLETIKNAAYGIAAL